MTIKSYLSLTEPSLRPLEFCTQFLLFDLVVTIPFYVWASREPEPPRAEESLGRAHFPWFSLGMGWG